MQRLFWCPILLAIRLGAQDPDLEICRSRWLLHEGVVRVETAMNQPAARQGPDARGLQDLGRLLRLLQHGATDFEDRVFLAFSFPALLQGLPSAMSARRVLRRLGGDDSLLGLRRLGHVPDPPAPPAAARDPAPAPPSAADRLPLALRFALAVGAARELREPAALPPPMPTEPPPELDAVSGEILASLHSETWQLLDGEAPAASVPSADQAEDLIPPDATVLARIHVGSPWVGARLVQALGKHKLRTARAEILARGASLSPAQARSAQLDLDAFDFMALQATLATRLYRVRRVVVARGDDTLRVVVLARADWKRLEAALAPAGEVRAHERALRWVAGAFDLTAAEDPDALRKLLQADTGSDARAGAQPATPDPGTGPWTIDLPAIASLVPAFPASSRLTIHVRDDHAALTVTFPSRQDAAAWRRDLTARLDPATHENPIPQYLGIALAVVASLEPGPDDRPATLSRSRIPLEDFVAFVLAVIRAHG